MTTQEYTELAAQYTADNLDQIATAAVLVGEIDELEPDPADIAIIQSFVQEACADVTARVAVELLKKGVLHDD